MVDKIIQKPTKVSAMCPLKIESRRLLKSKRKNNIPKILINNLF